MTTIYTRPPLGSYIQVDTDGIGMAIDYYINDELQGGTYLQGDEAWALQDQLDAIFDHYDEANAERIAWGVLADYF